MTQEINDDVHITGKVGIGIKNPDEKLEVDGKVKSTEFVGKGSEITDLNGENITTGIIDDARIPSTVARETHFDPTSGHKHTGSTGDGPRISHKNLDNILQVDPSSNDNGLTKHVSDALAKGWQDHINITSGNPHGLTLADLGALSTNGGTISGTLQVKGNVGIDANVGIGTEPTIGKLQFSNNSENKIIFKDGGSTDIYGISLNNDNNLNVFIPETSSFSVKNTESNGNETETKVFTVTGDGNLLIKMAGRGFASLTNRTFFNENQFQENNLKLSLGSTLLIRPFLYDFIIGHTVTFILSSGTRTNFVKKFSINQNGDLYCAGSKAGYVIDYFINRVGDMLDQGDVVVLSKYQVSQFSGTNNNIPVPEVDLTDKAYDTRVCGIVTEVVTEKDLPHVETRIETTTINEAMTKDGQEEDQFIHPLHKYAARISEELDPKKVKDQQMGKMATLGAFAHCKVDADIAPIEVGDLLTTSPTKGHAQKVANREKAIGSIIGKSLGSLEKGRGKIPIMVMLQ